MDGSITDRHFKDIIFQGISREYDDIKLSVYRDPSFNLDKIQSTMCNVYLKKALCRDKNAVGTRKTVMTAKDRLTTVIGWEQLIARKIPEKR